MDIDLVQFWITEDVAFSVSVALIIISPIVLAVSSVTLSGGWLWIVGVFLTLPSEL